MLVSHFELIWKPQSPAAPTNATEISRVIQGYFLEITNLEAKAIDFSLTLRAAAVSDTNRTVADNTLVFVDTPGIDNAPGVLSGAISGTRFYPSKGYIRIPAGGTSLVAVLPSAFGVIPTPDGPLDDDPLLAPTFEVRGYVELRVPALLERAPEPLRYRFVKQSDTPVKVLLTPQNRTTYYRADGTVAAQTQATLPLAEGKAQSEIVAETGIFFVISDRAAFPGRVDLTRFERLDEIGPLLAALTSDKEALSSFNKTLASAGLGVAVEAREPRPK